MEIERLTTVIAVHASNAREELLFLRQQIDQEVEKK